MEFEKFFLALDRELRKRVTVTVIGGAAIGLGYDPRHSTTDIDLVPVGDSEFWKAVERARAAHPIPVQSVPFFTPPYDYESRCTKLGLQGLKRLTILVPEVHDLAIMKAARALAHDLDAIEHIHRQHLLDLDTLVARYYEARTQVTGSPADFAIGFLALVESSASSARRPRERSRADSRRTGHRDRAACEHPDRESRPSFVERGDLRRDRLRMCSATVYGMIDDGQLRALRVSSGVIRVIANASGALLRPRAPRVAPESSQPVAITKRELNVRDAWSIGLHDETSIGIRPNPNDHPIVPEGIADAPVLGLLDWMKSRHDDAIDVAALPHRRSSDRGSLAGMRLLAIGVVVALAVLAFLFARSRRGSGGDVARQPPPWEDRPSIYAHVKSHLAPSGVGLTSGGADLPDEDRSSAALRSRRRGRARCYEKLNSAPATTIASNNSLPAFTPPPEDEQPPLGGGAVFGVPVGCEPDPTETRARKDTPYHS